MNHGDPSLAYPHAACVPAGEPVLARLDALEDGAVRLCTVAAAVSATAPGVAATPEVSILILRSGDSVRAYVNRCAHFGVPLATRQEHLKFEPHVSLTCNVHCARYRWQDGVCDRGECVGKALKPVPLDVDAQGCIRLAAPTAG